MATSEFYFPRKEWVLNSWLLYLLRVELEFNPNPLRILQKCLLTSYLINFNKCLGSPHTLLNFELNVEKHQISIYRVARLKSAEEKNCLEYVNKCLSQGGTELDGMILWAFCYQLPCYWLVLYNAKILIQFKIVSLSYCLKSSFRAGSLEFCLALHRSYFN